MFCTSCGVTISDDAKFCPHCGEDLEEVLEILKETPSTSDISSAESDLKLSLEGDAEAVFISAAISNEFKINVHNTSLNSIPGIEVQLSGLHYDEIISGFNYYGTILGGQKVSAIFAIRPQYIGAFTLTATLKSGVGHSLTFPIEVRVRTTHGSKIPITRSKPPVRINQALAGFIIVFLIGLLLIGIGISTFLSGGFTSTSIPTSVTLVVIGVICIGIGTKGQCCACACDDCDCDC